MRLVFLGTADRDRQTFRAAAHLALNRLAPDRVVYLGDDAIFDDAMQQWAREIVGGDPADSAVWDRAIKTCAASDHRTIDAFLMRERERERLRKVTCLPHAKARIVELFSGVATVITHDKDLLDGQDLRSAELVVFGKSIEPIFQRTDHRVLLSPGPLAHPRGGMLLLEEEVGDIVASILDSKGNPRKCDVVISFSGRECFADVGSIA